MKTLVLGGGQFQGRRAVEMLVEDGHDVTVVNRSSGSPQGTRYVAGDIDFPETVAAALRGSDFDVVIDNRANDGGQLRALLRRLKDNAGHYVLISSVVVYSHRDDRVYQPAVESQANLASDAGGDYDIGKRRCEKVLQDFDQLPWTILRFAQVEGSGDPSNRRGFWIDRVADGHGVLLPSDAVHPHQPVWRDDAARASVLSAGNSRAHRQTFNIAGAEIFTLNEWLAILAEEMGVGSPFTVQLPLNQLRGLVQFEYRAPLPLRPLLNISKAIHELNWYPTPANKWLGQTVEWWRNAGLTSRFWEFRSLEVKALNRLRSQID